MSDAGFLLIVGKIGPNFFGFQVTSWRIERFKHFFDGGFVVEDAPIRAAFEAFCKQK